MISYLLLAVCAVALAIEAVRAWRRPELSFSGLIGPVITVAVVLLLSRAIDWHEAVPCWVWPVLSLLAAVAVGIAVSKCVATQASRLQATAQTAPR